MVALEPNVKITPNREIPSDLKLRYRALEIYVFDVRLSVGKEIVCTFRFFASYRNPKYLHTRGTHQAHATVHTTGTKIDFFEICAFCVQILLRPHVD